MTQKIKFRDPVGDGGSMANMLIKSATQKCDTLCAYSNCKEPFKYDGTTKKISFPDGITIDQLKTGMIEAIEQTRNELDLHEDAISEMGGKYQVNDNG